MIIDRILDRKDAPASYNPADFYRDVVAYGEIGQGISAAMDAGTDDDVKAAMCEYVISNGYNPAICVYVCSVNWI